MIDFIRMSLKEAFEELRVTELPALALRETSPEGTELELAPDFYESLDDSGFAVLAKDGEKIVGFVAVILSQHQHNGSICASNDTIYADRDYPLVGGQLILHAEAEAKRFGAQFFQWAAPVGSRMDRMFRKRPVYHHSVQVIYEKEL